MDNATGTAEMTTDEMQAKLKTLRTEQVSLQDRKDRRTGMEWSEVERLFELKRITSALSDEILDRMAAEAMKTPASQRQTSRMWDDDAPRGYTTY